VDCLRQKKKDKERFQPHFLENMYAVASPVPKGYRCEKPAGQQQNNLEFFAPENTPLAEKQRKHEGNRRERSHD
jgi:hypothetical protein